MSCLGDFSRLTGQKRSPFPPAMMMTKRSLLDSAFMVFNGSHQRFYKSGHTGNQVGFLSAPSYLVDDGAADHDSFSAGGHAAGLFGRRNAKANGNWQIGVLA